MMNMTLKQLRYFEALARHGHFGRAAEASSISQPALSVQIKELEAGLGVSLFERGPRHVQLTGFGTEFAVRARRILREVEELGELARAAQSGDLGRLRLGIIPTIAPYLLPAVIARLAQSHPDLDVHVRETITPRLVEELTQGRLDAAIVALPISDPGLAETTLFSEDLVLVRPGTEEGTLPPAREDLSERRLLLLEEGHCFRDQALAFCNISPSRPREGLDGTSLTTLVQMVGAGIGVTLIPEMAVPVETRSAPVCINRFSGKSPSRRVGMIWRKSSPLIPQLTQIADLIRAASQPSG
ncbi:MAG: LysR substrate-binding domain-containing protein [Aliishimia sp.]